jgi:protein-S-isoprenylcysteine O-methyltransferase Ste14
MKTSGLELKIPPVLVVFITGLLMWLISLVTLRLSFPGYYFLSALLIVLGGVVGILGITSFQRAKTTLNPMNPSASSSLVTTGIYSLTRNPMYVGLLLVLLGWAVFLAAPFSLIFVLGFILYLTRYQIIPEERTMKQLFERDYDDYRHKVRRWL